MAIQIGAKPDSGFDDPLGLLSDCHRRIEKFLDRLLYLAAAAKGRQLSMSERVALDTALRYFRKGAPMHTSDEEVSLFPVLRSIGGPTGTEVLQRVSVLEEEHRAAESAHDEVDELGSTWLRDGQLNSESAERVERLLKSLRAAYRTHIAFEDDVLFPLARRTLELDQLEDIGREMAERRGLDYDNLPMLSRCAQRRIDKHGAIDAA